VSRRSSPRPTGRLFGISTRNASFFLGGERLDGGEHAVHDVLEGIIGERERELAGLDLGKVEHVVDEPKEMLAIALDALEYAAHLLRGLAIDVVEDELGCSRGWH